MILKVLYRKALSVVTGLWVFVVHEVLSMCFPGCDQIAKKEEYFL